MAMEPHDGALLADADYRQLLVSGTFEPHGDLNPEA
jgi:hypothetical protein